jgi:LmbE family N-acetylglucosaminyl deacetylase
MKIVAIGAHTDDVELGCGGTLLRHRDDGDEIHIVVITHSGYTSLNKKIMRSSEVAIAEGKKSAGILNAQFTCLGKEPLTLTPNEKLVLELEDVINRIQPDRVYVHRPTDTHSDHAAVGYVALRAARKCDSVLLYRSNWYIMDTDYEDKYYVDISNHIEDKKSLIALFESEMKTVNYSWIDFVIKQNCASGAKIGVDFAETFQVIKMVWR